MIILILAVVVVALDMISKYWITYGFVGGSLGYDGSWFDLASLKSFLAGVEGSNQIPKDGNFVVLSFTPNDAALFGLGSDNPWAARLLIALTAVFLFLLLFCAFRTHKKMPALSKVIVGLLVGGSIGNLYDRIAFGYVRDMIYAKFIHFPIFNLADAAICIAIALLVFETFFRKKGLFEVVEDDIRYLFRLRTREEAEQQQKERKAKRLSRFEEEIPDEPDESDDTELPQESEQAAQDADANSEDKEPSDVQ